MKIYLKGNGCLSQCRNGGNIIDSKYNIVLDVDGGKVVFNNLTNAMVFLYEREYQMRFEDTSIKDALVELGIMVNSMFNETKVIQDRLRSNEDDNKIIVIAPTTMCNMKCPYCFEKDVVKPEVMDREVEDKLIEFIVNNYHDVNLTIIWYGGEPLLQIQQIRRISEKIKAALASSNRKLTAGMITNGYLLTREIVDSLYTECNLNLIQITLDGCEEYHDKRRILKNDKPTFRKIVENIDYASQYIKISLRINVDIDNVEGARELLDYYSKKENWKSNVIPYVAPVTKVHEEMDYKAAMARQNFATIFKENFIDYFIETMPAEKDKSDNYYFSQCCALERKAWRGIFPHALSNVCGVVNSSYITIDPKGQIYKCWDTVGVKEWMIGDIYSGFSSEINKWNDYEFPTECLLCKHLPICMGGCIREYLTTGHVSCPYDKEIHEDILRAIYESFNADN